MADLTHLEKENLEDFLEMRGGGVLNFSRASFADFMKAEIGVDIYDDRFKTNGDSRARVFREFLKLETNENVATVLEELCNYKEYFIRKKIIEKQSDEDEMFKNCQILIERLKNPPSVLGSAVSVIDEILNDENNTDITFEKLSNYVKEEITKENYDVVLDRLHCFFISYIKKMCDLHNIPYNEKENKQDSLPTLFGKYVKHLRSKGIIETEATEIILLSNIKLMSKFNDIRNHKSHAHSNPLLNYDESKLLVNNLLNVLSFIKKIEVKEIEKGRNS